MACFYGRCAAGNARGDIPHQLDEERARSRHIQGAQRHDGGNPYFLVNEDQKEPLAEWLKGLLKWKRVQTKASDK